MIEKPLVSVVIPVYNTGKYVRNILDSIKAQTYSHIELIVVDDGSSDDSVRIVEETLLGTELDWQLLKLENGGVSRARNKGIEQAKGKWIFCPDSDDWVAPNTIEYMLNAAIENKAQCAFCEYKYVDVESIHALPLYNNGVEVLSQQQFKFHNLLRTTCVVIPGMVISREAFQNICFDEKCPYSEDTLYTWELIYQVKKAVWVKSDLYNYFNREDSKQHTLSKEKCLASIERYEHMTSELVKRFPHDLVAKLIQPKFILATMHVLARCINYSGFREVYVKTDKRELLKLLKLKDIKLSVFTILYKYLPYLFYKVARVR